MWSFLLLPLLAVGPAARAADSDLAAPVGTEAAVNADETGTSAAAAAQGDRPVASPEQAVESPAMPLAAEPAAVERITQVRYLDRDGGEPDWLESALNWEGGTYVLAIDSKLHRTASECRTALDQQLERAAKGFIQALLGSRRAAELLDYSAQDLRQRGVLVDEFDERIHVTSGPMRQSHALVAFNETFADHVRGRWQETKATSRLLQTGVGGGAVLLLLAAVCGYFRLDTATRGYYSGRLQFATATTILAVIAGCVLVARWFPWL